jgi:hypothetical protein
MKTTFTLAVLFGSALTAQAGTDTYYFGSLLSGSVAPATSFATLTRSTSDNQTYLFTLTAGDLNTLFTDGAFIATLAITDGLSGKLMPSTGGPVTAKNGGAPGGSWDFQFSFDQANGDRLLGGESVSWTASFAAPVALTGMALHVQGLTNAQGGSAWYVPSPVPEPETYAMLLAGLGMAGLMARRHRKVAAS